VIDKGRKNLIGVFVNAVDYEAAVSKIVEAAKDRKPLGVSALAVHGVMTGVTDAEHRHRLNSLELVVPDGQPVRWGLNLLHKTKLADRVYGPNLMLETCRAAEEHGLSIYLLGGTEELLGDLSANLATRFPDLKIARARPSKFRRLSVEEKHELIDDINGSGASIICVGLGCPRQEVWAYEFKDHINMPVLAVGAAFNFHAGLLDQAPGLLQNYGLEWLYRLFKEPVRLWRRYALLNPYYLAMLGTQRLGLRKSRFDPGNSVAPSSEVLYG